MRFSIRALLALMFLVALGMFVWRTSVDARRDEARLMQLLAEINSIQASLRQDQPALHQALLHTEEEFQPFRAMRELRMVEPTERTTVVIERVPAGAPADRAIVAAVR